jgi:oligogalacturonide transporter
MDIISVLLAYYMAYIVLRPEALHIVLGTILLTQIALLPVVVKVAIKVGKAKTFIYSALIGVMGVVLLGFYAPHWPVWAIFAIAAIMGAGLCGLIVMPWTMFPDVTDISELAFGERRAGSFAGIMTFLRKSSSALAIFLVTLVLEFAGYAKPIIVNGEKVVQEQPEILLTALRLIVSIIPIVFVVIAIYAAKKYPLSRDVHNKLNRYLKYKRGEEKESNLTEVEVKGLKELLI